MFIIIIIIATMIHHEGVHQKLVFDIKFTLPNSPKFAP